MRLSRPKRCRAALATALQSTPGARTARVFLEFAGLAWVPGGGVDQERGQMFASAMFAKSRRTPCPRSELAPWTDHFNRTPFFVFICFGDDFGVKIIHLHLAQDQVKNTTRFDEKARLITENEYFMSQHRSLHAAVAMGAKRNVLKRFERVELLKKRGQWKAGDRVIGLRKTKPE